VIAVVLDTNTLVAGLGWSGPPAVIVEAVLVDLLLVSSPQLLRELEGVLAYPKLTRVFPDPAGITSRLRAVGELVQPVSTLAVVTDEPDNQVLEAAVEARVEAVVTGDAGLLTLGRYDGIPIMSAHSSCSGGQPPTDDPKSGVLCEPFLSVRDGRTSGCGRRWWTGGGSTAKSAGPDLPVVGRGDR